MRLAFQSTKLWFESFEVSNIVNQGPICFTIPVISKQFLMFHIPVSRCSLLIPALAH